MIDVNRFLTHGKIVHNIPASNKDEAIKILVDKIFEGAEAKEFPLGKEKVYEEVLKREKLQTTGIGNGLAFPHARIEGWKEFAIAMATCKERIDFESLDGEPVKVIFLMISSPDEPYMILQMMSHTIRLINEMEGGFDIIKNFPSRADEFINKLLSGRIKVKEGILARDIIRPVVKFATLDMSVEEITRTMHLNRLDILPVVDEKGKFCGEVSCLEIFEYGMPPFFKQLNTVSFVRYIDPFEKYFRIRRNLKVRDLNIQKVAPIKRDWTLLEVIFEMTVKKKAKLFMVKEDGTLMGMIDRFCIIDKVLFF